MRVLGGFGDRLTAVLPARSRMVRGVADIESVGVVGAGTMGSGIAQVAATNGYEVVLHDVRTDLVDAAFDRIGARLDGLVEDGDLTADERADASARLFGTTALPDLASADFVVEAASENPDVKDEIFAELDDVTDDDIVLATNTSTLSITRIGAATDRPERVAGVHFMNPAPVMPGVELVAGERTSDETLAVADAFVATLGKETWTSADTPGFVVNRVLFPWIAEGIHAVEEGVAAKADVDRAMRLGTNAPMGPLELADHVGLDVCLDVLETLHDRLGERYRPPPSLVRKVDAGHLGTKTGRGFYEHDR